MAKKPDLDFKPLEKEDEELKKLRMEFGDKIAGESSHLSPYHVYDPVRFGPLVSFQVPKGYREVERYWLDPPYTFAVLLEEEATGRTIYYLVEPQLTPLEQALLAKIKDQLYDALPYQGAEEPEKVLEEGFKQVAGDLKIKDWRVYHKLLYFLKRDILGFGKLDSIFKDKQVEDISCDAPNIPVYLYHRKYYNVETNLTFSPEELSSYVMRMVERSGKHISLARPIVDACLPGGHRLEATFEREVSSKGSSLSIRKFMGGTFTPVDLIRYGTFSAKMLAYLWIAAENKKSIMIIGGTAAGKTSTLNALAFFIPPDAKIVSIEDTRELSLYQKNWIPLVTRETPGGMSIDMYELLRQALRQRPECIIVGEARGKEALAMFQALSTGHTAYCTLHAGSIQEAILRLESDPMSVPHAMLNALDIICVQILTYLGRRRVRRNYTIAEIVGVIPQTKEVKMVELFSWDPATDSFKELAEPPSWKDICKMRNIDRLQLEEEYERRARFLQTMADLGITDYDEVARLISIYFYNPQRAFEELESRRAS
jgi:flagellar protein FlaI